MKKLILIALILAPMTVFAQKFGHFESFKVLEAMPEVKTVQKEMNDLRNQYQKELETMREEIERKAQALQTQKDSLPENIFQRRQQEVEELYNRFMSSQETFQQELTQTETSKMQPIQKKIMDAIEEVGKAGGYVYIMDKGAGIPYISETLSTDVTDAIKAKLGIK